MSRNKHRNKRRQEAKKAKPLQTVFDIETISVNNTSMFSIRDRSARIHEIPGLPYVKAVETLRQGYERTKRDAQIKCILNIKNSVALTSNQGNASTLVLDTEVLYDLFRSRTEIAHLDVQRELLERPYYLPKYYKYQQDLVDWFTQTPEPSLPTYAVLLQIKENSYLQKDDWCDWSNIKVRWIADDGEYTLFEVVKNGKTTFSAGCRLDYDYHRALTHWTHKLTIGVDTQRAQLFLNALTNCWKDGYEDQR